jgi:hypothetical protein
VPEMDEAEERMLVLVLVLAVTVQAVVQSYRK